MLLQAAMAIFVVTVVIGILNGLDLVEFSRPTLLTHVHAGTLGWITLCVFAATLWLFSPGRGGAGGAVVRWLSLASIIAMALYVLAFFSANATYRPIAGALAFVPIAGFFLWAVAQSRRFPLTVPHLALLGALTSLVIGAILGVLLGLRIIGRAQFLPEGIGGAHPTSLVVGYLILAGMAITEWRLKPVPSLASRDRLGVAQVALPFLGGLSLSIGVLLNSFALITLNVPLEVLGVLIYLGRLGPRAVRVPWLEGSNGRLFALSMAFLVANVGLLTYLIIGYVSGKYERIELIPPWLFFAMDHAMFIGVMTNSLMGLVWEASRLRRSLWSWADHLLFWGMNAGVVGFVVGLILDQAVLKRIFTPIMGVSILVTMLAYTLRLQTGEHPEGKEKAVVSPGQR